MGSFSTTLLTIAQLTATLGGYNRRGNFFNNDDWNPRHIRSYKPREKCPFSDEEKGKLSALNGREKKQFIKELKSKYGER